MLSAPYSAAIALISVKIVVFTWGNFEAGSRMGRAIFDYRVTANFVVPAELPLESVAQMT